MKSTILLAFMICSARAGAQAPRDLSARECVARGNAVKLKITDAASIRRALRYFDRAIALDPKLAEAYLHAGSIRMALALNSNSRQRLHQAISLFRRCAEIEPGNMPCRRLLWQAYQFNGDVAKGREIAEQACRSGDDASCRDVRGLREGKRMPTLEQFYESSSTHLNPKDIADIP